MTFGNDFRRTPHVNVFYFTIDNKNKTNAKVAACNVIYMQLF